MLGESTQPRVELDLPRRPVVAHDQTAVVVEQHFLGHPAKPLKCALQPREPVLLPLIGEGAHMQAPRVTQRCHKHEHLDAGLADRHPAFAKINLHLLARWRLETHRRPRLRRQRAPQRRNLALDLSLIHI